MKKTEFEIRKAENEANSFIELNRLLKVMQICESGAAANQLITNGKVSLNGKPESRKRAKIRVGDVVSVADLEIRII